MIDEEEIGIKVLEVVLGFDSRLRAIERKDKELEKGAAQYADDVRELREIHQKVKKDYREYKAQRKACQEE
jgi:hypothetical protein